MPQNSNFKFEWLKFDNSQKMKKCNLCLSVVLEPPQMVDFKATVHVESKH